jgi:hypothetical protein
VDTARDRGFHVDSVTPEDLSTGLPESVAPFLVLSDRADMDACAPATRLDAIRNDGTVAFNIAFDMTDDGSGKRLTLTPVETLPRGWTYAITIRGGDEGCVDMENRGIEAFQSRFGVQ